MVKNDVAKIQSWLGDQTTYINNVQERDAEVLQLRDIIDDDVNITINPLCSTSLEIRHS